MWPLIILVCAFAPLRSAASFHQHFLILLTQFLTQNVLMDIRVHLCPFVVKNCYLPAPFPYNTASPESSIAPAISCKSNRVLLRSMVTAERNCSGTARPKHQI